MPMSDKIELNIIALSNSESQTGNFSLILEEHNGFRRLPIIIGPFEAQAIAVSLEKMQLKRPMTHDLFKLTLEQLGATLDEIIISDLIDNVFYSTFVYSLVDGDILRLDGRTSDAVAMAIRFDCPIYTTERIMSEAAFVLDTGSKAFTRKRGRLMEYSLEELEQLLAQVLAKEDYESAVKIRNAIAQKASG